MKLDAVLALVKPFLAADAKPDEIKAAVLAADKAAKDKAAKDADKTDPEGTDEFPEKDEPKGKDADPKDEPKGKDKGGKDKEMCGDEDDVDAEDNDLTQAEAGTPSKGGASKKPAMDSATVEQIVAKAVAARDALHAATAEVAPIVGARTFDSAGDAYKAALETLGVDLDGIPASAYRAMLRLAKDRAGAPAQTIALDSAGVAEVAKLIPNLNRLP